MRRCKYCGEQLVRRLHTGKHNKPEATPAFRKRRFCDRKCYAAYRRESMGFKDCQWCGRKFGRKYRGPGWEGQKQFANRRFCSRDCAQSYVLTLRHIKSQKRCKVRTCHDPHHAQGYCRKHYRRHQLYGNPYLVKKTTGELILLEA